MIQGVIFDMDGLMFDSERIWSICWEPALAKFGLPCKDGLSQAARGTTKAGSCDVLRRFYGEDCPAMGIVEELYGWPMKPSTSLSPKCPVSTSFWPGWTNITSPWRWRLPAP